MCLFKFGFFIFLCFELFPWFNPSLLNSFPSLFFRYCDNLCVDALFVFHHWRNFRALLPLVGLACVKYVQGTSIFFSLSVLFCLKLWFLLEMCIRFLFLNIFSEKLLNSRLGSYIIGLALYRFYIYFLLFNFIFFDFNLLWYLRAAIFAFFIL